MIDQQTDFAVAEGGWMGWPTDARRSDVLQNALAVVATTRREWASPGAAGEPAGDSAWVAHPLFRLTLDAMSSSAGRARAIRARARRRAAGQFAT